tara:strand:- start:61 stop:351 length:291 start_codon:yes stop_codon:yes gene_type:complete
MSFKKNKSLIKKLLSNQIVSITFVKANGEERKMNCRIPSNQKFFKGGELKGNRDHLLEVIDIALLKRSKGVDPSSCWRSINLETITSFKMGGKEWV